MSDLPSELIQRKFVDIIDLKDLDLELEIETDSGWVPLTHFNLTEEYDVWEVILQDGRRLKCADTHIMFDDQMNEIFVKDIVPDFLIMTKQGPSRVLGVQKLDVPKEHMADLTVGSEDHRFYTADGLLHHNTTSVAGFVVWSILFKSAYTVAVMANKMDQSQEILGRIALAYENLPKWMQQGVVTWNKRSIKLENNSVVFASATSSSAIRGKSVNLLICDEFAHMDRNLQTKFYNSTYPVVTSGTRTKVILISTPNGFELFSKFWIDAINKRNSYVPITVDWWDVPGRDEAWKKETIANTSREQFRQEFETHFIGSSDTLISPDVLATLTFENPIRQTEKVSIYEEPIPGHIYFIGVDVARGVGGDFSAFLVIDITQAPYKVVASFRDNNIAPIVYPTVIHYAATIYNNAFILVETNDVGLEIADTLNFELENENVLMTTLSGKNGQVLGEFGAQSRFGFRTTPATKRIGCFALKGLVENQQIILNDFELVSELTNFVSDGKNYSAEEGKHDDMVMCLVMFAWATNQTYFKDLVDADIRKVILDKRRQLLEEDMMPFGIFDNHVDPEPLSQEEVIEKDRASWMI